LGFLTDVAHLGAAAVWLGGLVVLLVVIRSRRADREVGDGAAAFSKLALPAIAVLILSGVVQGFRQISSWEGPWHTSYARPLLAKVLVVLAIMVIASGARNAVRSRMTHPDGDAAMLRELRHGVAVEAALAVVVVALTTALVVTPPARESLAAANHPDAKTVMVRAASPTSSYEVQIQ